MYGTESCSRRYNAVAMACPSELSIAATPSRCSAPILSCVDITNWGSRLSASFSGHVYPYAMRFSGFRVRASVSLCMAGYRAWRHILFGLRSTWFARWLLYVAAGAVSLRSRGVRPSTTENGISGILRLEIIRRRPMRPTVCSTVSVSSVNAYISVWRSS